MTYSVFGGTLNFTQLSYCLYSQILLLRCSVNGCAQSAKSVDCNDVGRVTPKHATSGVPRYRRSRLSTSSSVDNISSQPADIKARTKLGIPRPSGMFC